MSSNLCGLKRLRMDERADEAKTTALASTLRGGSVKINVKHQLSSKFRLQLMIQSQNL